MSIESVMPSNHLILWHPLLHLPSIFPINRVFSNESSLQSFGTVNKAEIDVFLELSCFFDDLMDVDNLISDILDVGNLMTEVETENKS